jgi:hypothetical protein
MNFLKYFFFGLELNQFLFLGVQVRPNDLKRALKGICLLLSRSAARIHRENGLLALRNATFRDPALDAGLDEVCTLSFFRFSSLLRL